MNHFLICYRKTLFSLVSLLFSFVDGHHLWETEAKVDRDASKTVSSTEKSSAVLYTLSTSWCRLLVEGGDSSLSLGFRMNLQ